jgi:5-(carboxyamino)imidazole ribonucleotide mutase
MTQPTQHRGRGKAAASARAGTRGNGARGAAQVAIVVGSASDLPAVKPAVDALQDLCIPHEIHIASAHRTPGKAIALAKAARERGLRVLIAAAGSAAHLAGVLAAHTTLPVIGIPVAGGSLGGLDALLSTVQMPSGVPVAAVAINGARNAALLAAQILAVSDPALAGRLDQTRREMARTVEESAAALGELA